MVSHSLSWSIERRHTDRRFLCTLLLLRATAWTTRRSCRGSEGCLGTCTRGGRLQARNQPAGGTSINSPPVEGTNNMTSRGAKARWWWCWRFVVCYVVWRLTPTDESTICTELDVSKVITEGFQFLWTQQWPGRIFIRTLAIRKFPFTLVFKTTINTVMVARGSNSRFQKPIHVLPATLAFV